MTEIEERAKKYIKYRELKGKIKSSYEEIYDAYIKGTTDQQMIDIKKACEWWEKILLHSNLDISYEQILFYEEQFKQTMEE